VVSVEAPVRRVAVRKPPRRKPVKKATIWLHRWLSLVLGIFLLVECTTGALLVYNPELTRWLRADDYAARSDAPVEPLQTSLAKAAAAYPDLDFDAVVDDHGTHIVTDYDTSRTVTVDGHTGEVIGTFSSEGPAPGWIGWTLNLSENIHECALTCEGDVGYVSWLGKDAPLMGWAGFEYDGTTYPVTWGGLILAVLGLLLVFLAISGVWLWWPTFKHFVRGVRIRFGKGRYARDYDLHQVVGMLGVPLLLLWGVTGMTYEVSFVEKGWYAVTPGHEQDLELVVDEGETGEITADEAVASAQALVGADATIVSMNPPAPDDATGSWSFWFADGFDPYAHTIYPGDVSVAVDRHDASNALITSGGPTEARAQTIATVFNYPVHSGFALNGWVRILWLVFGLVPLLLAWTGVSTWLFKRSVRNRRRRAATA
jgi:uncharacterized iron-regulated membrane protein